MVEFRDVVKKYTDPGEALGRDPDTGDVTGLEPGTDVDPVEVVTDPAALAALSATFAKPTVILSAFDNDLVAAIDALPEDGGTVWGTGLVEHDPFFIERGNWTLHGDGLIFKLKPQDMTGPDFGSIVVRGESGSELEGVRITGDIVVDGNKAAHNHGPGTVNHGEGINLKHVKGGYIAPSVRVVNTAADGIDLDHSFDCDISGFVQNAGGCGIHCSTGSHDNVVKVIAVDCGHEHSRAGIDQGEDAQDNVFLGTVARDCYRNYRIAGSGAIVRGFRSIDGLNVDTFIGIDNSPEGDVYLPASAFSSLQTATDLVWRFAAKAFTFPDSGTARVGAAARLRPGVQYRVYLHWANPSGVSDKLVHCRVSIYPLDGGTDVAVNVQHVEKSDISPGSTSQVFTLVSNVGTVTLSTAARAYAVRVERDPSKDDIAQDIVFLGVEFRRVA